MNLFLRNIFSQGVMFVLLFGLMEQTLSAKPVDGEMAAQIAAQNPKLSPQAIKNAFQFLAAHSNVFKNQEYMSIVNFDQPSSEERLYLINLKDGSSQRYLVTHGKNSADEKDQKWATKFSNTPNSKQSVLGFFRTLDPKEPVDFINSDGEHVVSTGVYQGAHGRSLRITGVQSINNNTLMREIVVHSATYATYEYLKLKGRLGLSWGCPAVSEDVLHPLIDRISGRSLYYIYRTQK